MDKFQFDENVLQVNIGSDFVYAEDGIDISQLEGYLGIGCPDIGEDGAAREQGLQQLASFDLPLTTLNFDAVSSSGERVLSLPESPPYSSGSEPYSPERLVTAGVSGVEGVATSHSHPMLGLAQANAVEWGQMLQRAAADAASLTQQQAVAYTFLEQGQGSNVPMYDTGAATSNRCHRPPASNKRRKVACGDETAVDLPPAHTLLLQAPPDLPVSAAASTSGMQALKQEMASPERDANDDIIDDINPFIMDITLRPIKWQRFDGVDMPWCQLVDAAGVAVSLDLYHVDADKGFNFSPIDDSFVCQKKNHFQVTCAVSLSTQPRFVCLADGTLRPLEGLYYHFYGVKKESPNQVVKVEQSQSDRSKKPFQPFRVSLADNKSAKVTIGRLHFTETTINNMRKKGKPNPDQRYFLLVAGLYAHFTGSSSSAQLPVAELASEKIIVRASNPGQFESDVDIPWHKNGGMESVYHYGTVGINTDRPDEALVVNGNVKVMGCIMQPSDERVKEDIEEVDSRDQLSRLSQVRMYRFKFRPEFGDVAGLSSKDIEGQVGVLAQELRSVLPDAVRNTGDVTLSNGEHIESLLVVNKDRLFMESVGAVKELCKVTETLESRMHEIEKVNRKLAQLKRLDSIKSTASVSNATVLTSKKRQLAGSAILKAAKNESGVSDRGSKRICSDKVIRTVVAVLIVVMSVCLAAIVALYLLDKQLFMGGSGGGNPRPTASAAASVVNVPHSLPHNQGGGFHGLPGLMLDQVFNGSVCIVPTLITSSCAHAVCQNVCGPCLEEPGEDQPMPYLLSDVWSEASPSQAIPNQAAGRRKRETETRVIWPDLFSMVSITISFDGGKRILNMTRRSCIACGVTCLPGCTNYSLVVFVHNSVPADNVATVQIHSIMEGNLNIAYCNDASLNQSLGNQCSAPSLLPFTLNVSSATASAGSGFNPGPPVATTMSSSAAFPSVTFNGTPTSISNSSYSLPVSFDLPVGAFRKQLFTFHLSYASNYYEMCNPASASQYMVLTLDVVHTCNTCSDKALDDAKKDLVYLQELLAGSARR